MPRPSKSISKVPFVVGWITENSLIPPQTVREDRVRVNVNPNQGQPTIKFNWSCDVASIQVSFYGEHVEFPYSPAKDRHWYRIDCDQTKFVKLLNRVEAIKTESDKREAIREKQRREDELF